MFRTDITLLQDVDGFFDEGAADGISGRHAGYGHRSISSGQNISDQIHL